MSDPGIVTFGIPLMAKSVAQDWSRIVRQLDATLGSIYAQTDPNFRVIIACTDEPEITVPRDARLEFVHCPQVPPMTHDSMYADKARRYRAVAARHGSYGGGYLVVSDADDLVSNRLVAFIRQDCHPDGYLVRDGYIFDAGRRLLAPFPFPNGNAGARFWQECGTCAVMRLGKEDLPGDDADGDNRFGRLMARGHPGIGLEAEAEGRAFAELPFRAVVYVRNTGENISARDAPALGRIRFQAYLDDEVERWHLGRTPELDTEFNLPAAEGAAAASPVTRRYEMSLGLSVLVATHRRPEGLRRLLTALRPQIAGKKDRELIVINDGTHDAAYPAVAAEFADIMRYTALDRNYGIAEARNAAVGQATGAFAVFTDDDCVPPPWWLDWLSARLRLHPEIDVVAGGTEPRWQKRGFGERLEAALFLPRPWSIQKDRYIFVTANAAIRLSLLRNAGGFGFPGFNGAGEDTELSFRLQRLGARFLVDTRWRVAHDVGLSPRAIARKHRRYGFANADICRSAGVSIPQLDQVEGDRLLSLRMLPAFVRKYRQRLKDFAGGPFVRAAALIAAMRVEASYTAGFRAAERRRTRR